VPSETPVQLRAAPRTAATTLASGAIEVRLSATTPLLHRDLFVAARVVANTTSALSMADSGAAATTEVKDTSTGRPRGRARLVGVVRGAGNAPLANARVRVPDADVEVATASDGSFRLSGLPAGTVAVEVIAIGYAPLRTSADLRAGTDRSVQVALTKPVATLDAVRVFSAVQKDRAGFAARRKKGLGYFINADEARMNGALNVATALLMAPSMRSTGLRGRGGCRPMIYLDGVPFAGDIPQIDDEAPFASIGGIEVYSNPADLPAQFGSPGNRTNQQANEGGCAVVIVWTKGFVP
jgi:Carboxypeptidase regulatory-like domain